MSGPTAYRTSILTSADFCVALFLTSFHAHPQFYGPGIVITPDILWDTCSVLDTVLSAQSHNNPIEQETLLSTSQPLSLASGTSCILFSVSNTLIFSSLALPLSPFPHVASSHLHD